MDQNYTALMIKRLEDFPLNEEESGNKTKDIMNKIRNISALKPDMKFVTIMHNAMDTSDWGSMSDVQILKALQGYELFLQKNS